MTSIHLNYLKFFGLQPTVSLRAAGVILLYMSAASEPESELTDHIGVDVDPEFKQEIRVAAAKQAISMSEFTRRALRKELE